MTNVTNAPVRLNYKKIRDVTTDGESENKAATYIVVIPAAEILKIGTDGNLRDYLPAHDGKRRTLVHQAIGKTIRELSDRFSQYNSGFLVGCSRVKVDDQKKEVCLWDASVNNGAQSQGEIKFYLDDCEEKGEEPEEFDIRVELSVEPDSSQRTEIAIARNTATPVKDISQAGKRGYFDELNIAFKRKHPLKELAVSESHVGDSYANTRVLLQTLWAMMPQELLPSGWSRHSRVKSYMNPGQCLSNYEAIYKDKDGKEDGRNPERYKYFCDVAGTAWEQYLYWRTHNEWAGLRLREDAKQARRKNGVIVAADGLIFPILSAMSNFVVFDEAQAMWELKIPQFFKDDRMLSAARGQLKAHGGKPLLMGRSAAAYEALHNLTEMASDMNRDMHHIEA